MHICYIDESGDSQPVNSPQHNVQPMLVIAGLFVDSRCISRLTEDLIHLKRRYYPKMFATVPHALDVLLTEIKGSDLRSDIRKNPVSSAIVQHHFRFLDDVMAICKAQNVRLVSRIWVKAYRQFLNDQSVYSISAQNIAKRFQHYLVEQDSRGMLIADFRDPKRNQYVAHSVFTQKHKLGNGGDAYPSIEETATFGISNNHACLQITDLLCSAIIAPIAGRTVCKNHFQSPHTDPSYDAIVQRYSKRLKAMQFNCSTDGRRLWGITVGTPHAGRTSIF